MKYESLSDDDLALLEHDILRESLARKRDGEARFARWCGNFDLANRLQNAAHARRRGYLDGCGEKGQAYEYSLLFEGGHS